MADYITLDIDIYPLNQRKTARVRSDVALYDLVKNIDGRFLRGMTPTPTYYVWVAKDQRVLDQRRQVGELHLRENEILVLDYRPPTLPCEPVPPGYLERQKSQYLSAQDVTFYDQQNNIRIPLEWMPLVLGRANQQPLYKGLERIRLENFYPENALRVSRDHAVIYYHGDQFYLIAVASQRDNPTYLNNQRLSYHKACLLRSHDTVRLGDTDIEFEFLVR